MRPGPMGHNMAMETPEVSRSCLTIRASASALLPLRRVITRDTALPVPVGVTTSCGPASSESSDYLNFGPIYMWNSNARSSALPVPEGAFNRAPDPSHTKWRNRDPLKHRLHLCLLEEEMCRQRGKNTLNNIKSNTAAPETSISTARRHEDDWGP